MKKFLFILLLFVGNVLLAQDPEIGVKIITKNEETGRSLSGATIEIYQDGKKIKTIVTDSKGKIPIVYQPIGHVYVVKFKKAGFVTKVAQIDARFDTPEDLPPYTEVELQGSLFEEVDGVDFAFMENDPIISWEFSPEGYMTYDGPSLKQKLEKIEDLKEQIAEQKEKLAEEEAEMKKREADFQAYVDAGDKAMPKKSYQTAIEQYELALKIKDDATVKAKLADAKKKLAEVEGEAQKEKDYQAKLMAAKNAFDAQTYEQAIKLYQEAQSIKPNEQLPKDKIAEIQKILNDQKAREKEFDEFVKLGDDAVASKSYDNAISKYQQALGIKQDPLVQTKLDNAKNLKAEAADAEKAEQEKEAKYMALINSADKFYDAEKWQDALVKYQEALTVKPGEPIPTAKIAEINKKLEEQEAANAVQKKYDDAIKKADDLFVQKKYSESKVAYQEAQSAKPAEEKPGLQIQKINDILKQQADQEEEFNKLVDQGDVAVGSELYTDAILKYEEALKIKTDPLIQTKIDNAKKLRDDKTAAANAEKDKEEKYSAAIESANKLFDSESWQDAITKYNEALSIKPGEAHPTNRIKEINKKIADEKAKNDAAQKLENDYTKLITDGNSLYNSDKLQEAKLKYQEALKLKPGEAIPTSKIDEINLKLADLEAQKKKDEEYQAAMNKGAELFNQKKYTEALSQYNLASGIKSNEQEPKDKIIAINKILNDQKNADQLEEEYQNFMTEGSGLLANNDLTTALDRYKKAIGVKPGDAAAQVKINEIDKLIKDKQDAEQKDKDFSDLVAKGTTSFNAKNYQDAKLQYQKALAIKSDSAIEQKIIDIDKLIAENQSATEQQALFDKTLKEANNLFASNDYELALSKYQEANSIQESQHAKDQILIINKKLADQKANAEKEEQYNSLVTKASGYQTNKEYQLALDTYQEAFLVKPDPAISEKIRQLTTLIEEENQNKSKDQAYQDKIDLANTKFEEGDWQQAKGYYEQAKQIKASESYPDNQIAICDEKMQGESIAEIEKQYQKIITKANGLRDSKSYDEAISYYERALGMKPNDSYPKDQITDIQKIKNDQANAQNDAERLEREYNDLVKSADELYNANNYTAALEKYNEALAQKPTDSYVIGRIADVKLKLANQVNQDNDNSEYDQLITEGDALMNPGTWVEARAKYEAALRIKEDSYPKAQINKCIEMMKKEGDGEAEKEYQKILTVAQKKMDEGDLNKALELYKRAQGIRPSDPIPPSKIAEINQMIQDKGSDVKYQALIQKADNLFEKQEWKSARKIYVEAYNMRNDSYPDEQIIKIDAQTKDFDLKQYNKMISKADEYFKSGNYEKAKGLYLRAIKFQPKWDNTYPNVQLQKIKDILNPPLATNNAARNLGDPVVGMTEEDMENMLVDAEEQRKFNEVDKVTTINEELVSSKTNWGEKELNATNDAKDLTVEIREDITEKEWEAEVEREKAEQAVIEQKEVYDNVQSEIAIYNEHALFRQKERVENIQEELAESNTNADIPRMEFEEEVVSIQTDVSTKNNLDANAQINENFDTRNDVIKQQEDHVTLDPNKDVARKNTEVKVVDMQVAITNEQMQNTWDQENAIYSTKEEVNVMLDEQIAARVNSDVPRQDTEDEVVAIEEANTAYEDNLSRSQYDVLYDTKSYTDHVQDEINIMNINNDVPRQKMEDEKTKMQNEINTQNIAYSSSQNAATNNSKDYVDDEQKVQNEIFSEKDKERADDAENIIIIQEDIDQKQINLVADSENASYDTKDDIDKQQVLNNNLKANGNNKTVENQDNTTEMVEDLTNKKAENSEENQEKVNETSDYVTELKEMDAVKEEVHIKNKLGEKYPNGVTEEIYQEKDANGQLTGYVIRRVVVIEGEGYIYEKVKARYGVVTYTKNGVGITEAQWQDETNNADLVRHN